MIEMKSNRRGKMSHLYRDMETGETIRTYAHPLHDGTYLFIDISYNYLYRHDGLL